MSNIQSKLINLGGNITGTLPIANGGTANVTAAAAFNALSPITTTGDMIYSASGATNSRLAVGTSSQVLAGGTTPTYTQINSTNFFTSGAAAAASTYGVVQGGKVPGDTTGSSSSAGFMGQVITGTVQNSGASFSNGVLLNVASVNLTAGKWLIFPQARVTIGSALAAASFFDFGISSTNSGNDSGWNWRIPAILASDNYMPSITRYLDIGASATYYTNIVVNFASGSCTNFSGTTMFAVRIV